MGEPRWNTRRLVYVAGVAARGAMYAACVCVCLFHWGAVVARRFALCWCRVRARMLSVALGRVETRFRFLVWVRFFIDLATWY